MENRNSTKSNEYALPPTTAITSENGEDLASKNNYELVNSDNNRERDDNDYFTIESTSTTATETGAEPKKESTCTKVSHLKQNPRRFITTVLAVLLVLFFLVALCGWFLFFWHQDRKNQPILPKQPFAATNTAENIIDCSQRPSEIGLLTLWNGKQVKCNEGWTSIMLMRLQDRLQSNKSYAEYEAGFGFPWSSHWTGLKLIADMMTKKNSSWKLRYKAVSSSRKNFNGIYNEFSLDAKNKYRLHVGSFVGDERHNVLACNRGYPNWNQNGSFFFSAHELEQDYGNGWTWSVRFGAAGFWYNNHGNLQHHLYSTGRVGKLYPCTRYSNLLEFGLNELSLEMRPN